MRMPGNTWERAISEMALGLMSSWLRARCGVAPAPLARCLAGGESVSSGVNAASTCGVPRVTTSSLLLPVKPISENKASLCSHKLMLRMGLVRQSCSGMYHFLPMGFRALEKLIALIDECMRAIGAVKLALPIVAPSDLWKRSGRWDEIGSELFKLQDRHGGIFCLGPTHEEVITNLVKEELVSKKQLPLKLYQLDRKFRDEMRPARGLLRAREFWMKDLYTFDETVQDAMDTYQLVCQSYEMILKRLNLPILKVSADPGSIGGSQSHEYQIPCSTGENDIMQCRVCGMNWNKELVGEGSPPGCPNSPSCPCELIQTRGIEVAHVFFLGTKYSDMFDMKCTNTDSSVQMGCYGIGISRLLAAAIEYGCADQSENLVWPHAIAPYSICVTPMAHRPSDATLKRAVELYDTINSAYPGDVVLEDRLHLTLGARMREVKHYGYPVGVIVGDKVPEGSVEVQFSSNNEFETQVIKTENITNWLNSKLQK